MTRNDAAKLPESLFAELQALRARVAELENANAAQSDDGWIKDQALLFDGVSDAVLILDQHLRIQRWNKAAERVYGWRAEEVLGQSVRDIIPFLRFLDGITHDELERILKEQGSWSGEVVQHHRDGHELCAEISSRVVRDANGDLLAIVSINRDITERRQAQEALRESEALYRSLVETSPDAIVLTSLDGTILVCNQQAALLHGYSESSVLTGMLVSTLIAPEDHQRWMQSVRETLKHGFSRDAELRLLRKDGSRVPVELNCSVIRDASGRPKAFIGIARDITVRKQVEAELRKQEALYRLITEHTADLIALADTEGRYLYVSPSHRRTLGYDPAALLGQAALDFVHNDDRSSAAKLWAPKPLGKTAQATFRYRRNDGEWCWIEAKAGAIDHENASYSVIVGRDLSERIRTEDERRQLEMQLLQIQKMESIGTLAGGIAHDMNNVLAAILGNAQVALHLLPPDAAERVFLLEIEQAGSRGAALTNQLLSFSRRRRLERTEVNINDTISDILSLLQRIIGADVEVATNLADDLPQILANASQLQQVVMNLVINARDAMSGPGRLTITTGRAEVASPECARYPWVQPGEFVKLSVSDTGQGMAPELLERIFEPFFTTKEVGKGTGLGLSVVYGIVRQHVGFLEVESTLGQGTTFHIYLPLGAAGPDPIEQVLEKAAISLRAE